ncbi:hypothetical protein [Shinella sp.]|uniref:hypothetical protein n=1 Tax=Shinella sp. TaxID=1870904 RepID=UPI003F70CDC9
MKPAFGRRLLRGEKAGTSRARRSLGIYGDELHASVVAVIRMSNIDIDLTAVEIWNDKASREGAAMTTNLHVSFPDEMHVFVDMRANGENQDATSSENMRELIREDVAREEDRRYAVRSLLKAEAEFRRGEILPLSALDAVDAELNEELG